MPYKKISKTLLLVLLMVMLLVGLLTSCGGEEGDFFPTKTPITPSPTLRECDPDISYLSRTEVVYSPLLLVILYEPTIADGYSLEFKTGERTTNPSDFIQRLLGDVLICGDQSAVFELGYKGYEAARILRYEVDACDLPPSLPLYESAPTMTIVSTPIPLEGLPGMAVKLDYERTVTAQAATATEMAFNELCGFEEYIEMSSATEDAWSATQTIKVDDMATSISTLVSVHIPMETPYSSQTVFDGLSHASTLFSEKCDDYSRCVLLIISQMQDRRLGYKNIISDIGIDLTDVEIISVMPQCDDIFQPSCVPTQVLWAYEFMDAHVDEGKIIWRNGDDLEAFLIENLKGGR